MIAGLLLLVYQNGDHLTQRVEHRQVHLGPFWQSVSYRRRRVERIGVVLREAVPGWNADVIIDAQNHDPEPPRLAKPSPSGQRVRPDSPPELSVRQTGYHGRSVGERGVNRL